MACAFASSFLALALAWPQNIVKKTLFFLPFFINSASRAFAGDESRNANVRRLLPPVCKRSALLFGLHEARDPHHAAIGARSHIRFSPFSASARLPTTTAMCRQIARVAIIRRAVVDLASRTFSSRRSRRRRLHDRTTQKWRSLASCSKNSMISKHKFRTWSSRQIRRRNKTSSRS